MCEVLVCVAPQVPHDAINSCQGVSSSNSSSCAAPQPPLDVLLISAGAPGQTAGQNHRYPIPEKAVAPSERAICTSNSARKRPSTSAAPPLLSYCLPQLSA